jgi:hypothetical protein
VAHRKLEVTTGKKKHTNLTSKELHGSLHEIIYMRRPEASDDDDDDMPEHSDEVSKLKDVGRSTGSYDGMKCGPS